MLETADARLPWRVWGLLALIFTPLSILVTGYGVYLDNHAMQIPLVQQLNNPGELYAGDPFALSLLRYGSPVWHAVAAPVKAFGLEPTLLTLFILNRLLAIGAIGLLAWALNPGSRLGMMAAMAFLATAPEPLIGAGTLLERIFEHTSLALGFFMLSFAALQARRRWAWAILWSVATWCNLMYGIFASIYLAARLLAAPDLRSEWRGWLRPLGLALLLSLPLLIWSLVTMKPGTYDPQVWMQVNLIRAEHHMNPYAWGGLDWLRFAVMLAAVMVAGVGIRRSRPALAAWALSAAAGSVIWLGICTAAYHLRHPSLQLLHGARATDLFYLIGTVALLQVLAVNLREASGTRRWPWALLIFAVPGVYQTSLLPWLAVPVFAALGLLPSLLSKSPRALAAGMVLPFLLLPVPRMIEKFEDRHGQLQSLPDNDVALLARWARRNTEPDAIFLIDPEWSEFRPIARRPVFVTWKDAGAIPWQRDYAAEWVARMNAMGADVLGGGRHTKSEAAAEVTQAWEKLDDARVAQLAAHYGIQYWIAPETTPSQYPVLELYGDSKVLRVGPPPTAPGPVPAP